MTRAQHQLLMGISFLRDFIQVRNLEDARECRDLCLELYCDMSQQEAAEFELELNALDAQVDQLA